MSKSLQPDSEFNRLDTNGDGVVDDEEFLRSERMIKLELLKNEDQKQDAQLRMIWFALLSLLLFPALLMLSSIFGLDDAGKNLTEMSSIFFLTIGGLVSVYFGSQAIRKNGK
tara:strand:- start:117 stop:452 length:336 start_codon:yes stop_codon:yes gene_type:complete